MEEEIYEELCTDVRSFLATVMPDYHDLMPECFAEGIVADVIETSSYEDDGMWTESDIRLSFEREIASMYIEL